MSEPARGVAVPDTRLHPIYLIIGTAKTLRQAIPLLMVTIFGGAPWWVNAVLFALVMVVAVAQWHVKKYSVVGGVLLLRSGVVNRSVRAVPNARITAVAASQSLTQRLVGVWRLTVQSPGDRYGLIFFAATDPPPVRDLIPSPPSSDFGQTSGAQPRSFHAICVMPVAAPN
jgi:putative membrane protein